MCFTYSCGCRMCMRHYLYFRTLYGYEIRNLFSLYRVQFNDGSSPLLNNCFRLQSQLQMQKLLWHDPRVNLTIAHRNLINIFFENECQSTLNLKVEIF